MPERVCTSKKKEIVIGNPGAVLVPLLAEHAFRRPIYFTNDRWAVQRLQSFAVVGVDAGRAAQGHDLWLPQVFGIKAMFAAQVTAEFNGRRTNATDEGDIFLAAQLQSQFESFGPGADRLAATEFIDLLLAGHRVESV